MAIRRPATKLLLFFVATVRLSLVLCASHDVHRSHSSSYHHHLRAITKDDVEMREQVEVGDGHERVSDVERRAKGSYGGGDLLRPRAGGKKNAAAPASSMLTVSCLSSLARRLAVSVVMSIFFVAF